MNILEKIIAHKRIAVAAQKEAVSIAMLEKVVSEISEKKREGGSLKEALLKSPSGIIAEFKRKSPSKGWIQEEAKVETIVPGYERAGAAACSILTDEQFFGGGFADLKKARSLVKLPILRKDFMIDEYQLYQAKILGADIVLLIASALSREECRHLATLTQKLGMEVLLEIHNEAELDYIGSEIDVVGINNRDLTSFVTDVKRSFELGKQIPDEFFKISESGISDPETVRELRQAGFRGFLMGENFMKSNDPANALDSFIKQLA